MQPQITCLMNGLLHQNLLVNLFSIMAWVLSCFLTSYNSTWHPEVVTKKLLKTILPMHLMPSYLGVCECRWHRNMVSRSGQMRGTQVPLSHSVYNSIHIPDTSIQKSSPSCTFKQLHCCLHIYSNRRKCPSLFWYVLQHGLLWRARENRKCRAHYASELLQNSYSESQARHPGNG